jgi:hypothetical protein
METLSSQVMDATPPFTFCVCDPKEVFLSVASHLLKQISAHCQIMLRDYSRPRVPHSLKEAGALVGTQSHFTLVSLFNLNSHLSWSPR